MANVEVVKENLVQETPFEVTASHSNRVLGWIKERAISNDQAQQHKNTTIREDQIF